MEIATPVCGLARNDEVVAGWSGGWFYRFGNGNQQDRNMLFLPTLNDVAPTVKCRTDAAYFVCDPLDFNFLIPCEMIGMPVFLAMFGDGRMGFRDAGTSGDIFTDDPKSLFE